MHVLRYLLFLVVGFALCLAFERLSFAARDPLLWRVSALMYSLSLVSYPLWCCIRAIADTLRARSTDEEVEVPIAATLLYRGLAAFAVLRSGSFADALVTGTVTARGLSALGAAKPERRTAIASRLVIYGIYLLVLIEIVIFGCVVGTGEPAQTMLSVIAITIAAAAFACVIIPAVVSAAGLPPSGAASAPARRGPRASGPSPPAPKRSSPATMRSAAPTSSCPGPSP